MKQCKGTIVFDVDGVLLDFYGTFLTWYNEKHGTAFHTSDLSRYDIASGLNIDPQEIVDFHAEDACGHLPLLETDAPALLQRLKGAGYQIVFNTDFPLEHMEKRHANLAEHALCYDAIHFRAKEHLIHLYDDIVAVVEDNPKWIRLYAPKMIVMVPKRPYLDNEELPSNLLWYNTFSDGFRHF